MLKFYEIQCLDSAINRMILVPRCFYVNNLYQQFKLKQSTNICLLKPRNILIKTDFLIELLDQSVIFVFSSLKTELQK